MQNIFLIIFFILYVLPNASSTVTENGKKLDNENESQQISESNDDSFDDQAFPALIRNNNFYCPAEGEEREILHNFSQHTENIMKTLFEKLFHYDENKICSHEVEPVLVAGLDNKGKHQTWGKNASHRIYLFAFQLWNELQLPHQYYDTIKNKFSKPKLDYSTIYTICHDTSINAVIWTEYEIPKFQNTDTQSISLSDGISTESFCFHKEHFSKMDAAFKTHNENSNNYKMIKQKLLPDEHLSSINIKATNHHINTAPLWDKLATLMKAINDGIRNIDYRIKTKSAKLARTSHEFKIYTKLSYPELSTAEWAQIKLGKALRIPNLWCKFIHYKAEKSGLLIYIHNTPERPPREDDRKCKEDEIMEPCNFENWIDDDDVEIPNLQYAYCCNAAGSEIVKYFGLEEEVEKLLQV